MTNASPNKLFRSPRHRSVGGVCAGIALARGWSVSLVRTLCLLLMSISGLGVILYLALWLALPTAETIGVAEPAQLPHDPFLRSSTDRKVAGVCGGLARYVQVDSLWVRVVYVMAILCGGLGVISYVYAWLIVPPETERLTA